MYEELFQTYYVLSLKYFFSLFNTEMFQYLSKMKKYIKVIKQKIDFDF